MKLVLFWLIIGVSLPLFAQSQRTIAITIDDLPVVSTRRDMKTRREITRKLLAHIKKGKDSRYRFRQREQALCGRQTR